MKFNDIFGLLSTQLQKKIHHHYGVEARMYEDDCLRFELSPRRITQVFSGLNLTVRENYLRAVHTEYVLTPERFELLFGSDADAVQERMLYLPSPKHNLFVPVEELVSYLCSKESLVQILIRFSRDALIKLLAPLSKPPGRDKLISLVLKDEASRTTSTSRFSPAQLHAAIEKLSPVTNYIGEPIGRYYQEWHDFLCNQGVTLRSGWGYSSQGESFSEALERVLEAELRARLLFRISDKYSQAETLVWHPLAQVQIEAIRQTLIQQQLQELSSKEEPLIEPKEIRLHDCLADLYRKALVVASKLHSGELQYTKAASWRSAQVKKIAALLCCRKDDPTEFQLVELLASAVEPAHQNSSPRRIENRFAQLLSMSPHDFQHRLRALHSRIDDSHLHKESEKLLSLLPPDRWLLISDLRKVVRQFFESLKSKISSSGVAPTVEPWIHGLYLFELQADVVLRGPPKQLEPYALRLRKEPSAELPQWSRKKVALGPHFEAHLPPDLHPELVLKAHHTLHTKDPNTVTLDHASLDRLVQDGCDETRALEILGEFLELPLPKNVMDVMHQHFGGVRRAIAAEHFSLLYLPEGANIEAVKEALGTSIARQVDDRLLLLHHTPNAIQISKLRAQHIVIDFQNGFDYLQRMTGT